MSQYIENLNKHSDSWTISTNDYEKYSTNFKNYAKNAWLDAGVARDIFTQSNLAPHLLYQVWNLADTEKLGKLNEERFIVAMHLIFKKLEGKPLPSELPVELKPGNVIKFTNESFGSQNASFSGLSSPTYPTSSTYDSSETRRLEDERNRKQQQLSNHLKNFTSVDSFETKSISINSEVERFVNNSTIPMSFFENDIFIREKLNQPKTEKLDKLILEANSIKEEDLEKLVKKFKDTNKKVMESELELFSLEDSKLYGYTIPGQKSSFSPINISNGSDPISQKAAAILNQRLQALNLSSASKEIPESAKERVGAKKLDLQKKQQENNESIDNMASQIRSLLSQAGQLITKNAPNHTYSTKELKDRYNIWKQEVNSSSEIGSFLKSLFKEHIEPTKVTNAIKNLPIVDVTPPAQPVPSKVEKNSSFSLQQSNHSDTFDPEDKDNQPKTPEDPSGLLNPENLNEKSQIALASRQAREKARMIEKNSFKDVPARPLSPKPSSTSFRMKYKLKRQDSSEQPKVINENLNSVAGSDLKPKPSVVKASHLDNEHPQETVGVGAIRAAARLARQKALENIATSELAPPSRPGPPPVKAKPAHLAKKPSFQQQTYKPNSIDKVKMEEPILPVDFKPAPKFEDNVTDKIASRHMFDSIKSQTHEFENQDFITDFRAALKPTKSKRVDIYPEAQVESIHDEAYEEPIATYYPEIAVDTVPNKSDQVEESAIVDPTPTILFKVQALYDYNDDEESTTNVVKLKSGDKVVVTSIPEDNPGWCLGYPEYLGPNYTGWIPSAYLDLPGQDNHSIPETSVEAISPDNEEDEPLIEDESSGNYARLTEDFEADIEGGTVLFGCDDTVELVDQSNPDWFLAKHPQTGDLAYLPSDQIYLVDKHGEYLAHNDPTNPFARNQAAQAMFKSQVSSTHDLGYNGQLDMDLMSSPHRKGWASQMDAETLASLSPTEIKRKESMFELVATEKTYLRDMQLVLDLFYLPLQSVIDSKDIQAIFSNLEDLVFINTTFLSDIEPAANDQDPQGRGIGDIFLEHIDSFKAYAEYCGNQASASRQLNQLYSDAQISDLLQGASSRPECRMLTLNSFLLEPVQRITRYPLLLRQIQKYTPKDHPSYDGLEKAFVQSEVMLKIINSSAQLNENTQRLKELADRIDLPPGLDLLASTRNLGPRQCIIDGPLTKHKSSRSLHGFLFNDLFLVTEVTHPNSSTPRYTLYRPPIPLLRLQARDAQTSQGRRGIFSPYDDACFQVIHAKDVLTLRAATASTKKKWMNELTKAITYAKSSEGLH